VGFDYWDDRFIEVTSDSVKHVLPPASCKVISLYPARERPQLVSTSRHVTQGIVDVLSEVWDARQRRLSGTSRIVAGDPYELRVALPKGGSWQVEQAVCEDCELLAVDQSDAAGVRIRLLPAVSGEASWSIRFRGE
jgi:hypothetical protein